MKPQRLTRRQISEQLDNIPAHQILSNKRNLTHKQKQFCKGLVDGLTKTDAMAKAYNYKGKRKTMSDDASRLAKDPRISAEVEALERAKQYLDYQENAQKIAELRSLVVSQLTKEALDPKSPPNARIQALAKLGSVSELQVFTERKIEKTIIKDSESARAELMAKLKQAMADNMRTIDEPDDSDELLAIIAGGKPDPIANSDYSDPTAAPPSLVDVLGLGNTHSNPDKRFRSKQGVPSKNLSGGSATCDTETPPVIISGEKG
jgi:phage terminase small subunit